MLTNALTIRLGFDRYYCGLQIFRRWIFDLQTLLHSLSQIGQLFVATPNPPCRKAGTDVRDKSWLRQVAIKVASNQCEVVFDIRILQREEQVLVQYFHVKPVLESRQFLLHHMQERDRKYLQQELTIRIGQQTEEIWIIEDKNSQRCLIGPV